MSSADSAIHSTGILKQEIFKFLQLVSYKDERSIKSESTITITILNRHFIKARECAGFKNLFPNVPCKD